MAENNNQNNKQDEPVDLSRECWTALPFDKTTNFSLLGWFFSDGCDPQGPHKVDLVLK